MKHTTPFIVAACMLALFTMGVLSVSAEEPRSAQNPNFIIIFADDQGYGDLSVYGSTKIKTPEIDRMADEGMKFTSFMVASPVCTPSRAALLTGSYPSVLGCMQASCFLAASMASIRQNTRLLII